MTRTFGLPRPFTTIYDHLRPFTTIYDHLEAFGIILKPLSYVELNSKHILWNAFFPKIPLNGCKWPRKAAAFFRLRNLTWAIGVFYLATNAGPHSVPKKAISWCLHDTYIILYIYIYIYFRWQKRRHETLAFNFSSYFGFPKPFHSICWFPMPVWCFSDVCCSRQVYIS